jgi:hypothetical protein
VEIEVMANAVDHIENFHRNAYILSPILEVFYKFSKERDRNITLSYLVFPLILHPESRNKLKFANKNSSIYTIFSEQSIYYGLSERVDEFKEVTNKCILLLDHEKSVSITRLMSIMYKSSNLDTSLCSADELRAAKNLSILLNSHEIVEIYRKLGIKMI